MMKYLFFIVTLLFSSLVYSSNFSVEGFEMVSSKRVNVKEYVIEYRVQLKNNGVDVTGLTATISTEDDSISLLDDSLTFEAIASGEIVESIDTFSIKKDRTKSFDYKSLIFNFSGQG